MQQKHELECDIYRATKIPLEAFEESTVKANDDKHETKIDEASADGELTVDDTLFEKPMLPRRSNEEIENCSEMAKLSPKVDIESRKQQNNEEENGYDHEGKNEEEDSEESNKEDTVKGDVFNDNLESAYDVSIV